MTSHPVQIISHEEIIRLNLSPKTCLDWVEDSFRMKDRASLKPKISLHPQGEDFFNTMPCLLPPEFGRLSIKEVYRIAGQEPALGSDILLYDSRTGKLLALLDGDWITTMRTGAVAALAARIYQKKGTTKYSFIGLGNTARATALCLLADNEGRDITFQLLRYKNQAEDFMERFKDYPHLHMEIVNSVAEMVPSAEVIISCLTASPQLLCPDDALFPEGILVIPVHTRGFQNCDLFFDKVFGDDTGHICEFKYFSKWRQYAELTDVLLGRKPGRENQSERILAYNYGIGLHDALYSSRIYDMLKTKNALQFEQSKENRKFWI